MAGRGPAGMMAAGRRVRQRGPIALLCLLLAGCGPQAAPERPPLRVGLAQPVLDIDPRRAADAGSARLARLIVPAPGRAGRRLPAAAGGGRLAATGRPALALHAARAAPALHGRGAVDGGGRGGHLPGSARVAGGASPLRAELGALLAVDEAAAGQVDFTLSRPDPLFPARLTLGIAPARCAAPASVPPCHYDGSGPFALTELSADRVRLRRRRDGLAVDFQVVPDPTVRVLKLLRGELDLLQNDLPPELLTYLAGRPGVQLRRAPGSSYHYLGFNLADPVTGDLRVRQAAAYAIDREALVRHLLGGAARLAGSVLPPGHYAAAKLPQYGHDPARARRLLAQAGHAQLRLTYKTSTDPLRLRIATAIQAQLAAVGIGVRVQSNEWGSFFGDIRAGRFQLYSLAWVGITQPDVLRQLFHSASLPPAGANRGRFISPPVDALLDAAAQAQGAEQVALYRQAQRVIHADLPYVPLWYEDNVAVARAGLRGYALRPDGAWDALEFTDPPPVGPL